jgi:hypothetical protein
MRPAGHTLLSHEANDAWEELKISSINQLEKTSKKPEKQQNTETIYNRGEDQEDHWINSRWPTAHVE